VLCLLQLHYYVIKLVVLRVPVCNRQPLCAGSRLYLLHYQENCCAIEDSYTFFGNYRRMLMRQCRSAYERRGVGRGTAPGHDGARADVLRSAISRRRPIDPAIADDRLCRKGTGESAGRLVVVLPGDEEILSLRQGMFERLGRGAREAGRDEMT